MKNEIDNNLLKRLNLPEKQIQELLSTGSIQLSSFQKNEIVQEIERILLDNIESEKDIITFKRIVTLASALNHKDVSEINEWLNEFLSE